MAFENCKVWMRTVFFDRLIDSKWRFHEIMDYVWLESLIEIMFTVRNKVFRTNFLNIFHFYPC